MIENVQEKLRSTDEDVIIGDNSKIKSELGWKPTKSLEKILEEMYNFWLKYYSKTI